MILRNKNILVTGAGKGIGLAVTREAVKEGNEQRMGTNTGRELGEGESEERNRRSGRRLENE